MKSFIALLVLAAVAVAEPEADAQIFAAGYPYGYYANPHATAGLTTYSNGAVTPTDTLSVQAAKAQHFAAKASVTQFGYGLPYYGGAYGAHLIGKREAEADSQYLGYGVGYPFANYGYSAYTGYGYPRYGAYGAHVIGKREAEPKAEADAQYLYNGLGYTAGGLVAYPDGAVTPQKTLAVQIAEAQHFAAKGVAPYYNSYAAPYYGAYGAHLIGKREAEPKAEADAQFYGYAGYPAYGAEHTSLGLTTYANGAVTPTKTFAVQAAEAQHFAAKAATAPYSYGYAAPFYGAYGAHLIGKREAEPKADSQFYGYAGYPYATYGAYSAYTGYGYPYAYNYLG